MHTKRYLLDDIKLEQVNYCNETYKFTTTFYIHLKNVKVLRDTRTDLWLPFAHARHGSIAPRRARTCWFVTGQWLHVEPTCVAWLLHCGLHCCFRKLFATYTWHCQTWPSICFVLTWYEAPVFNAQTHNHGRKWKDCASVPENGLSIWCD